MKGRAGLPVWAAPRTPGGSPQVRKAGSPPFILSSLLLSFRPIRNSVITPASGQDAALKCDGDSPQGVFEAESECPSPAPASHGPDSRLPSRVLGFPG